MGKIYIVIFVAILGGLVINVMLSALCPSDSRADDVIQNRFRVNNASRVEFVLYNGFQVNNKGGVLECLTCHDGSIATARSFCLGESCSHSSNIHPVNVPCPPAEKRNMFNNPDMVKAAGIKLVHGLVTCVSCHNLANPKIPHLVIENDHSKLCLTCHIK